MDCINIDASFSTSPLGETINTSSESHRQRIRHLYRRLGYGAGFDDINDIPSGTTFAQLADTLIEGAAAIEFPTEFNWTDRPVSITRRVEGEFNLVPETINGLLSNYWINESIVDIENSIRAKLMLFWHGHFAVEEKIYQRTYAVLRYYKLLFTGAFGNFKEFVKAIGLTPITLMYLNGNENNGNPLGPDSAQGGGNPFPNENYARELLELFTMGIKYEGSENYSREEINMLARSLSGWRVGNYGANITPPSEADGELRFHYNRHDWTNKTLFGIEYGGYATGSPYDETNIPVGTLPADRLVGWDKVLLPSGSLQRELFKPFESGNGSIQPYTTKNIVAVPYEKDENDEYPDMPTLPSQGSATYQEIAERKIVTAGLDEYNFVHDEIIFKQKQRAIAYFICKKLYKFYVYADTDTEIFQDTYNISTPTTLGQFDAYIEKLANVFIYGLDNVDSNLDPEDDTLDPVWSITDVLKVLFKSEHFYDVGLMGTQIKSPVACAASFFRAGNLQPGGGNDGDDGYIYQYRYRLNILPDNPAGAANWDGYKITDINNSNFYSTESDINGPIPDYKLLTGEGIDKAQVEAYIGGHRKGTSIMIRDMCGVLGQKLLNPPDVAGWPGHHNWLNEFTLIKRWEMISNYLLGGYNNSQTGLVEKAMEKFWDIFTNLDAINPTVPSDIMNDPILSGEDPAGITFIFKVWRYFFAVDPTARQIKNALSVFLDNNTYTFGYIINQPTEGQLVLKELLLHLIRQPEFQLA